MQSIHGPNGSNRIKVILGMMIQGSKKTAKLSTSTFKDRLPLFIHVGFAFAMDLARTELIFDFCSMLDNSLFYTICNYE